MSLPKRDGVNGRYYLIHKVDTSPEAAEKLIVMDYDNLAIKEITIVG